MKLLITIFTYALLSLAFLSLFEVEQFSQRNDSIVIPTHLTLLFIIGIFGILFSYITYTLDNSKLRILYNLLAYIFAGFFSVVFFSFFMNALNSSIGLSDAGNKNIIENFPYLINFFIESKIISIGFSIVLVASMIFIILDIIKENNNLIKKHLEK